MWPEMDEKDRARIQKIVKKYRLEDGMTFEFNELLLSGKVKEYRQDDLDKILFLLDEEERREHDKEKRNRTSE